MFQTMSSVGGKKILKMKKKMTQSMFCCLNKTVW